MSRISLLLVHTQPRGDTELSNRLSRNHHTSLREPDLLLRHSSTTRGQVAATSRHGHHQRMLKL